VKSLELAIRQGGYATSATADFADHRTLPSQEAEGVGVAGQPLKATDWLFPDPFQEVSWLPRRFAYRM